MRRMVALVAASLVALLFVNAPANAAVASAKPSWVKVQTDWGYLSARQVKMPKVAGCVKVPVAIDIRNISNMSGMGLRIEIVDAFDNAIGYQEFDNTNVTNGKYATAMDVCGTAHKWTHPSGNRTEDVAPFKKGETYTLRVASWLNDNEQGSAPYKFLK